MAATTTTARTAASTLKTIMRYRGLGDQALGDAVGYSRAKVSERKLGRTAIDANDLDAFSAALNVPVLVLLRPEQEALAWVVEHRPNPTDTPPDGGSVIDLSSFACTRSPADAHDEAA